MFSSDFVFCGFCPIFVRFRTAADEPNIAVAVDAVMYLEYMI